MTRLSRPQVQGILETCINVSDMNRARTFYESLFGFEVMAGDERFCVFRVGHDVLLLFTEGESKKPIQRYNLRAESFRRMRPKVRGTLPSLFPRMRWTTGGHYSGSEESRSSLRFDGSGEEPACIFEIQTTILSSWGRLEFGQTISSGQPPPRPSRPHLSQHCRNLPVLPRPHHNTDPWHPMPSSSWQ